MSPRAFLRSLGPVCVRCGMPVTCQFSIDIDVRPTRSCADCEIHVRACLYAALSDDAKTSAMLLLPTWRDRIRGGIRVVREAKRRGWRP